MSPSNTENFEPSECPSRDDEASGIEKRPEMSLRASGSSSCAPDEDRDEVLDDAPRVTPEPVKHDLTFDVEKMRDIAQISDEHACVRSTGVSCWHFVRIPDIRSASWAPAPGNGSRERDRESEGAGGTEGKGVLTER